MLKLVMAKLRRTRRNFSNSEKGATAVEFAMVAGPFFLILGVIIETGLMLFSEYALQSAVQDSGRLIRTGQAQTANYSSATFKAAICNTAGVLLDCNGKVTVYVNHSSQTFAQLNALVPAFITIGPSVTITPFPATTSRGSPSSSPTPTATPPPSASPAASPIPSASPMPSAFSSAPSPGAIASPCSPYIHGLS